jgi:hypothetical protein
MKTWPLAAAMLLGSAASAQTVQLAPIVDTRLRWEQVDQDGLPREAEAVTVRVRAGVKADRGPLQALLESEATLALATDYNSGVNGKAAYPLVADAQNIALNRAQLRYAVPDAAITAGRQLMELADQRFVGSMNWRQNQQTFDAARVQIGDSRHLFADVTYAWSVRTVTGIDGTAARPQAIGGDNVFALAGTKTPLGTVTGFAYLVDQDVAALQNYALSSQTYGIRLAGTRPLSPGLALAWTGSWARQSGWHRNPNRYAATYWLAEGTLTADRLAFTAGHEVLGADSGRALTSVQTPLASLFKFNGWDGKFTTTPPDGLRDLYATGAVTWKALGPFSGANLSATWHRFRSDRLDRAYGEELDLLAGVKHGRTALSVRYARYRANGFATDTDKAWLEADWLW